MIPRRALSARTFSLFKTSTMKPFLFPVLAAALVGFAPLLSAADSPPNVVILYADDMGVADVSYGDPKAKIQTPNLDRLASEGMTFTDGHSSSGICTPSRFALLTGQHRRHVAVGHFDAAFAGCGLADAFDRCCSPACKVGG